MRTNKTLAKVFGPALLLTATLAMPMDTAFAKEHGRAAAHAQANKHEGKGKGQQHRQQGPRVEKRVEKRKVTKRVEVRRQAPRRQQVVRQQRVVKRQVVRQPVVRRQVVRRQVVRQPVIVQQPVVRQRVIVRQPQNRVYRDNRRYDDRYYAAAPRRGRGGADPNVFHVDGYLDDGGDCLFLRDHEGRTWAMVGNTYGLQPGEHVRLYGRPTGGGACGNRAAAFDIYEVRTVWADNNHRRTYYDHLYDGPFDQNRAYEDDRYYNGEYDTYEDRQDRDSWWDRLIGG
jgi:hypothetical protein